MKIMMLSYLIVVQLVYVTKVKAYCFKEPNSDLRSITCENMDINTFDESLNRYNLIELRELNIITSDTKIIKPGVFNNLNYLRRINITRSNISQITKGIFTGLHHLEHIYISANNISTIEQYSFYGLNKLTLLNISHNNLLSTEFVEIDAEYHIDTLDLSYNEISDIRSLDNCKSLIHVNLTANAIAELDGKVFVKLTQLTELSLSKNLISQLNEDCFSGMNKLEILNLADNQIAGIPIGVFKHMESLISLNLSTNKIASITLGTFSGLVSLEIMDMSFNRIRMLPSEVLHDLHSITTFFIHNNSISDVNAKYLVDHLPFLKEISLDRNTWTCNKLSEVVRNLHVKQVRLVSGSSFKTKNINGIACSGNVDEHDNKSVIDQESKQPTEAVNIALDRLRSYFDSDFKQSEFYKFFNEELFKRFEGAFKAAHLFKYVDDDFVNSKFYKYFTDGYINATFFEYLDKKIEVMNASRGNAQYNKSDYEQLVKDSFNEYFESLKSTSSSLKGSPIEDGHDNNAILKSLNTLMVALLCVMLFIWLTLSLVICKFLNIQKIDAMKFFRSRYSAGTGGQHSEDLIL